LNQGTTRTPWAEWPWFKSRPAHTTEDNTASDCPVVRTSSAAVCNTPDLNRPDRSVHIRKQLVESWYRPILMRILLFQQINIQNSRKVCYSFGLSGFTRLVRGFD